ncbi:hypothetical protein ACTDI4_18105 [Mesorhizobium sp. PUT5]|uniref:hypothetical protein n=1 Tax=Mesorhizobium sp. PUT5 TaxID=3454629 RepID=UPI003FA44054
MADEKEKTQRRVYVLPVELVERITAFQQDMGLQSEVEAARKLLDEALKRRDDWRAITRRFQEKLKETRMLTDIAGEVLVGHPLVEGINFASDSITFKLTTGETVTVNKDGTTFAIDDYQNPIELDPKPSRSSPRQLDDEIPF